MSFYPHANGTGKRIAVHFEYDKTTNTVGNPAPTGKAFTTWAAVAQAVKNEQLFLGQDPKDKAGRVKYQAVRKLLDDLINNGPPSQEDMKSDEEEEEKAPPPPQQVTETSDKYKDFPDLSNFQVSPDDYNLPPNTLPAPGSVFVKPLSDDNDQESEDDALDEKNYNYALRTADDPPEDEEKKEGKESNPNWVKYDYQPTNQKKKTMWVWKEWMDTANNSDLTFVHLIEKVNSQMEVIDNEMREFVARKKTTYGARSDSFLAALRTHLIRQGIHKSKTETTEVNELLEEAIHKYWSTVNPKTKAAFNYLVETLANCSHKDDMGDGIAFHVKQFRFSQENQLLGKIKREMLWPLIDGPKASDYTGHSTYTDAKKVYPLHLLQMSKVRYEAQKQLQKNKRSWEQSHPLTFMADKVIAFKNKLVRSDNIHDKILLVILCVGSRWIEVVKMSDYYVAVDTDWKEAADQKGSTYFGNDATRDVVVRGIAKARKRTSQGLFQYVDQDTVEEKNPDFDFDRENRYLPPKPVLFLTVQQIQYLVYQHIRPYMKNYCETNLNQPLEEVSPKTLAERLNHKTNARLKSYVLTANPDRDAKRLTTHALRKVYGNYSYQEYADQARITKIAWLNKVLGHKPSSFSTALHYNTAYFSDAVPKDQDYGDRNVIIADLKQYTKEAKEINTLMTLWKEEDIVANVTRIIQNLAGKRPLMIDKRSDADNLGKIPFVTKKRKIIYLDPVQRSGISHNERYQKFMQTRDAFTTHNITHSYDNYNRLGFSSSYIAKQKKQRV